jgi:hypothetical protein
VGSVVEKKEKLANAIRERISAKDLGESESRPAVWFQHRSLPFIVILLHSSTMNQYL